MREALVRLDDTVDQWCERVRDHRGARRVFDIASTVGDFSIIWHVIGLLRAIGSIDRLQQAIALSCALGVESLIVNQGIKRLFRRDRPTTSGDHRFDIRTPSTSSFPSGHASSATCAVVLLTSFSGVTWLPLWATLGAIVAASRVVVRIHHFSDIVGGIVVGAVLGLAAVPVVAIFLG